MLEIKFYIISSYNYCFLFLTIIKVSKSPILGRYACIKTFTYISNTRMLEMLKK